MRIRHICWLAAAVAALTAWSRCSAPEPPLAPVAGEEPAADAGLRLELALPKPLVSVVDSIVAVLAGPLSNPVVVPLSHTPSGPAAAVLGAIVPGEGFSLTVEAYDHDGQLILRGEQDGITVAAGDTVAVALLLELVSGDSSDTGDGTGG